jgi:hypothetical protein
MAPQPSCDFLPSQILDTLGAMRFSAAATDLRRREIARLSACVPPSLANLRTMTPGPFRSAVALMLERLGYEVINHPAAHDLIVTKLDSNLKARKYVVTCADPANMDPTGTPALGRLVEAVMTHGAYSGFYVTARSFTQQARDYAKTMPQTLRLVDGPDLEKSMRISLAGVPLPIRYDAMCTECGDTVRHKLDEPEAVTCQQGHTVAPTIPRAAIEPKDYPVERKRRGRAPQYNRGHGRRLRPGR